MYPSSVAGTLPSRVAITDQSSGVAVAIRSNTARTLWSGLAMMSRSDSSAPS
jgi:hypothetical protein